MLTAYAKKVAEFHTESMATWYYGYAISFLAEYSMATGDKSVLPGMKRMTMEAALGQSAVGTWGHKFAMSNGNLNGYGCMNVPGLTLTIGMVLARQAGVSDPALDSAITKAAVLFDLLGDREAASFFAKMSKAAYSERERGHTGNFFNVLWAMPGVSRCSPLTTGAYLKETAWNYDLARGWEGSFAYQGSPVGEEEHNKYTSWDSTGAYMLALRAAANALFSPSPGARGPQSILADSLDGVDRKLLYPAVQSLLENEDSAARGSLGRIYGKLADRDLVPLLPAVVKAVEKMAPSNEMFADGIRLAGLDLLSRLHIREGMTLCIAVIEPARWGSGKRVPKCLECLARYGSHAKEMLPKLQEMRKSFAATERGKGPNETVLLLDKSIAAIGAATATPTLVDLKHYVSHP